MAGSSFGNLFQISTWGESHGPGVGVVIDGCPSGVELNEDFIQKFMDRRKPGQTRYSTPRKENDLIEILSGVWQGKTTGTPISLMVRNQTQRSKDYSNIQNSCRPGHADYTYDKKYGNRDYRGGGRSSGRETIGRVAAGAVAQAMLQKLNIAVSAYTKSIGDITIDSERASLDQIMKSPLYMPDLEASERAEVLLEQKMKEQDSVGGIVECIISGLPAGVGEPVFEKLDANLAKAVMSIGAVKGVEIGDGFAAARAYGSENNDHFYVQDGVVRKQTNHAGGILGGISDGDDIILRAAIKPTPSIAREQDTIEKDAGNGGGYRDTKITIQGRHDPIIVPRAVVVVESMAAICVMDMLMQAMTSDFSSILSYYQ